MYNYIYVKGNFAEQISCRFKILIKLGCSKKKSKSSCLDDFLLFDYKLYVFTKIQEISLILCFRINLVGDRRLDPWEGYLLFDFLKT